MSTCNECLFQVICDVYADAGVTDVPKSDVTPCELFANKGDYVTVVRCRECKYYKTFKGLGSWCHRRIRSDIEYKTKPYDFCSYGVRRNKE